jgi:fatty-acid peroxygenase
MALMREAIGFLIRDVDYRVPRQDLRIDSSRLPALPRSRFILTDLRVRDLHQVHPVNRSSPSCAAAPAGGSAPSAPVERRL